MKKENSPVTPSNRYTWEYIRERLECEIVRIGRSVVVKYGDGEIRLPPYPEVDSVEIVRKNNTIIPKVPSDWVAQWKANGSNTRLFSINGVLLGFTRGGFLLDWKPYMSLVESDLKDKIISLIENEGYVLFGELVGPKSLVRICPDYWKRFLNADIGYLVFDIFDLDSEVFIGLSEVYGIAEKYGIMTPPVEKDLSPENLTNRLEEFIKICNGEVWEGFVFKNQERGPLNMIFQTTKKWRLDETKEYAERIFRRTLRDPFVWKILEAVRKFVFEGYLDPPITRNIVDDESFHIRNRILEFLEKLEKGEMPRDIVDKKIKRELYELLGKIVSDKTRSDRLYKKAEKNVVKLFRKLYVYTY